MATANMRIDQAANAQPAGVAGRARKDLLLSEPVTLRNNDDTGVSRHLWAMLDRPIGSNALLSSPSSPFVTFIPDVPGSYRISLVLNDGLAGERQIKIAAVADGFTRVYPAAGQQALEANWPVGGGELNELGWAKEVERILRSLGSPQILDSVPTDTLAISASETSTTAGVGLPDSSAEVVAYDFVDAGGANVGAAPTVNDESFLNVPGVNALARLCAVTIDFDTSGTTSGDVWAVVMLTETTPLLLAVITIA